MNKLPVCLQIPFLLLLAGNGMADDFRVVTNAALREEYDDNIYLNVDTGQDDFITTTSLGLALHERTELLTADLVTSFNGLSYANHDELNNIEEYYKGSVKYQLNPLVKFSADAGYSTDSRPDRDIEVTGLVLTDDLRRRQSYSCAADYQATEKTALFSSYSYQDDQFETNDTEEFTGQNVLVGLTRSLNLIKPTALRFYGHYSHYNFYSSKVDNYSLTAGFSRQVTEKLSFIFDVGPRYTEGIEKRTDNTSYDNGLGGQFSLTYDEELTSAEMSLFHEVSGSGGRDGATERTGLQLELKHRLAERSSVRLTMDGFLNRADSNAAFGGNLDELTTSVSPSFHYEFSPDIFCEAAYRYTVIDNREADHERHRNLVFVKLTYQYPVVE